MLSHEGVIGMLCWVHMAGWKGAQQQKGVSGMLIMPGGECWKGAQQRKGVISLPTNVAVGLCVRVASCMQLRSSTCEPCAGVLSVGCMGDSLGAWVRLGAG